MWWGIKDFHNLLWASGLSENPRAGSRRGWGLMAVLLIGWGTKRQPRADPECLSAARLQLGDPRWNQTPLWGFKITSFFFPFCFQTALGSPPRTQISRAHSWWMSSVTCPADLLGLLPFLSHLYPSLCDLSGAGIVSSYVTVLHLFSKRASEAIVQCKK